MKPTDIVRKTSSYTLTPADSGKTFVAAAGDTVFTLPPFAAGFCCTILDASQDTAHPMIVRPQPADQLAWFAIGGVFPPGKGIKNQWGFSQALTLLAVEGFGPQDAWVVTGSDSNNGWAQEA